MKILMIILLFGTYNGTGASATSVEFESMQRCEVAKTSLYENFQRNQRKHHLTIVCVKK